MTNQLKRVNCSLFLDPVNSPADRYAVGIMQRWVEERKELVSNPSAGTALHRNLHMHKDIYLSGLFLHLLSPALTSQLAEVLSESNVNTAMLAQKLKQCGLVLPSEAAAEPVQPAPLELSPQILELTSDLKSELAAVKQEVQHGVGQMMSQVELQAQAERQAQADAQAQAQQPAALDPALLQETLASLKADIAAELKQQSQAAEIAELKAMISAQSQLIRSLQHNQSQAANTAPAKDKAPEVNLSEQIASVQKIKKKGLF
ncbi:hypothetical protein C9I98_23555 [Photobacterium sanctipauli]|uniref:Uncharacterized protein n=1 Tax=Photobacterium sanctipauli TaxID=1342794 RepID=A0A2T3NDF3_9GAMM|nr:hypothetical protein [Photobacterium sanctipauli]PSW12169.1 hypothetical protein C9I98_23555 [Photobacterium sanctipauli]